MQSEDLPEDGEPDDAAVDGIQSRMETLASFAAEEDEAELMAAFAQWVEFTRQYGSPDQFAASLGMPETTDDEVR